MTINLETQDFRKPLFIHRKGRGGVFHEPNLPDAGFLAECRVESLKLQAGGLSYRALASAFSFQIPSLKKQTQ